MATFVVGAINTDKTNRHESINDSDKLGDDIVAKFNSMNLDLITLSEVSTLKCVNRFAATIPDKDIYFVNSNIRQNYIVQAWDMEKFDLIDENVVTTANYVGVSLQHRESESRQLHISVHLPHKSGRVAAQRNLASFVVERLASGNHDEVFLHGDFNIKSTDIAGRFQDFSVAFDDVVTTRNGRSIDNVRLCKPDGFVDAASLKIAYMSVYWGLKFLWEFGSGN
eukprot:gene11495-12870_t